MMQCRYHASRESAHWKLWLITITCIWEYSGFNTCFKHLILEIHNVTIRLVFHNEAVCIYCHISIMNIYNEDIHTCDHAYTY